MLDSLWKDKRFTGSVLEVLNVRVSFETVLPTAFMPSMTSVDANDVVDVTGVAGAEGGAGDAN